MKTLLTLLLVLSFNVLANTTPDQPDPPDDPGDKPPPCSPYPECLFLDNGGKDDSAFMITLGRPYPSPRPNPRSCSQMRGYEYDPKTKKCVRKVPDDNV